MCTYMYVCACVYKCAYAGVCLCACVGVPMWVCLCVCGHVHKVHVLSYANDH